MRFRDRSRSSGSAGSDEAVAARLTRVVGPEPGVFRLTPADGDGTRPASDGMDGTGVGELGAGARTAPGADPAAVRRALAALDPGRRAVRALMAVALVVAVAVGFLVWRSRPRAQPVPAAAATATGIAATPSPAATIVVSVIGRVQRPGLVRLPHGARVADAIEAAGGVLPGTDLGYLNLARKVVDGELLAVGLAPSAPGGAPGPAAGPPGLINLNTATVAELDTLPGVGPVLAQRIVDHRNRTGGFRSVEELRTVEGVGDARFEQIKDLVTV
jgi:competence protein ComEA